jgi:hypothetical protein
MLLKQGIGPRRLDTIDRTTLIDKQLLFYDASSHNNFRRAASTAPRRSSFSRSGSGDVAERASSVTPYASSTSNTNHLDIERPGALRSLSLSQPQRTLTPNAFQEENPRPAANRAATYPLLDTTMTPSPSPSEQHRNSPRASEEAPDDSGSLPVQAGRSSVINGAQSGGSRTSSLLDRLQQEDHLEDGGSSDGPTILTYEESEAVQYSIHPEDHPSGSQHTGTPLGLVQTNVSHASVSSASDHDERGRSLGPAGRLRANGSGPHQHNLASDRLPGTPASPRSSQLPESAFAAPDTSVSPMGPGAAPAPSALRNPSIGPRSPSRTGDKPKSARFSLSSLVRGMSTTKIDRQASPERQRPVSSTRAAESTSRGRASGLQAIKNALTGHHSKASPNNSDSEEDSDDEENDRGRVRHSGWQEFKPGTYNYPIHSRCMQ